jgi:glycosyltransferase involved in cell wall biosynthesis
VKRGIEVKAIVHHISELQKPVGETEIIDGVPVTTLPRKKIAKLRSRNLYKTDADIIHSQSGMFDTYLAFKLNPEKKKIITFQDLRTEMEYKLTAPLETSSYPWYKALWARYVKYLYKKAVRNANLVCVQAELLKPKVKTTYGKEIDPVFLPNFIDIPEDNFKKKGNPTVLWLARLDPIKRPELCFDLARECPGVDFLVLGESHSKERHKALMERYKNVQNLFVIVKDNSNKERPQYK